MKLTKKQADELRTLVENADLEACDELYDLGEEGECDDREEATANVEGWLGDLRDRMDDLLATARKFKLDV